MSDEPQFLNRYRHCEQEWTDEWSCTCNDRCPTCGAEIEPHLSEDLSVGFDPTNPGEIDVVDENGDVIGSTAAPKPGMETPELDKLLTELMDTDVPMASQADLNHLFGIKPAPPSPYGEEFGSFG